MAYVGADRKLSTVSDVNDASVQMLSSAFSKMSTKTSRAGSDAGAIKSTHFFYKHTVFRSLVFTVIGRYYQQYLNQIIIYHIS